MVHIYKPGKIDFWVPATVVEDMHLQLGDVASISQFAGQQFSPPIMFHITEARQEEQDGRMGIRIRGIEDGPQVQIRPLSTCDTAQSDN